MARQLTDSDKNYLASWDIMELRKRNQLSNMSPTPTFGEPPDEYEAINASTQGTLDDLVPGRSLLSTSTQPTQSVQTPQSDIEKLIQMYRPETAATKRFEDLTAGIPQYEKPSLGRKLVAMGVGVKGGIDTMDKVLDQPYKQSMADWKAKADPAYQAATLERYANANERALLGNVIANKNVQDRIEAQEIIAARTARIREEQNIRAAESARINALANQYRALGLGWEVNIVGSEVLASKPAGLNGEPAITQVIGHTTDMDERGKIELQNAGQLAAARAIGGQIYNTGPTTPPVNINERDPSQPAVPVQGVTGPVTRPPTTPSSQLIQGMDPKDLAKIRQAAAETLVTIDLILDEKGNTRPVILDILGESRFTTIEGWKRWKPGDPHWNADIAITNLKAKQIINLIAEMKNQSETGATGFGQLTGPELTVLTAAASRLSEGGSIQDFNREVNIIKEKLLKILQPGPEEGGQASYEVDPNWSPIQRSAAQWLATRGQKITPANINATIQAGKVR